MALSRLRNRLKALIKRALSRSRKSDLLSFFSLPLAFLKPGSLAEKPINQIFMGLFPIKFVLSNFFLGVEREKLWLFDFVLSAPRFTNWSQTMAAVFSLDCLHVMLISRQLCCERLNYPTEGLLCPIYKLPDSFELEAGYETFHDHPGSACSRVCSRSPKSRAFSASLPFQFHFNDTFLSCLCHRELHCFD
jgi:hypothetical protein